MSDQLVQVMQALTSVHERFNEQAAKKEKAIQQGDMPELDAIMKAESPLIQQLRKLENTRMYLVQEWMRENGVVKENITMDQLLPMFPGEQRGELQYWAERLMDEIGKLRERNERNQLLLQDSLKFVNMSLDAMTEDNRSFAGYSDTGSADNETGLADGPGRSLFDSKA